MALSITNLQIEATDSSDKTNDGMVTSRSSTLVSSRDATPMAKETNGKIECKFVYPATTVIDVKLRGVEKEMKVLLFFEQELPNMVMNIKGAEEDVKTAILALDTLSLHDALPICTFETVRTAQTNQTMRRTYAQLLQPNQKIIGPISLESLKEVKTFQRVGVGSQTPSPPKITADVQSSFGAPASFQRSPVLPATVGSVTPSGLPMPLFPFSPKTSDVPASKPDIDVVDKRFTFSALTSSSQDLKATVTLASNTPETTRVSFTAPSQPLPASSGLPRESKSHSPSRFSLSSTFGPASLVKFKPEEPFLVSFATDGHSHKRKFDATTTDANDSAEKSHSVKGTNFAALPVSTNPQSQSSVVTASQQFKGSFGPTISSKLSTAAFSFAQSSVLSKLTVASGENSNASNSTNYASQPTSFSSSLVRNPMVPSVAASDAANPPRVYFEQPALSTAAPTFIPPLDRGKFSFASATVNSASLSTNFNASHFAIATSTGYFAPLPRSRTTPNLALTASSAAETRLEQTGQDPGTLLGQALPRYGEETGKTRAYCCDELEEEDYDDDEDEREDYEMLLSDEDEHGPEAPDDQIATLDPASACQPGPSSDSSQPVAGFSPSHAFKVTLSTSTSTRRVLLPTPGQETTIEPAAETPSATAAEFVSDAPDQKTSPAGEEKKMVWRKVSYYQGEPQPPLQTNRGGFGFPKNSAGGNNGTSTPQQLKLFQPGDFANGNNVPRGQVSNRKQSRRVFSGPGYSNEDIQAFNAIFSSEVAFHVNLQGVEDEAASPTFVDTHMHLDFALNRLMENANYAFLKKAAANELWSKYKELNKVTWPERLEVVFTDFCWPEIFMHKDWQDFLQCCLAEPQIRVSIGVHPHWATEWDVPGVQDYIRTIAAHSDCVAVGEMGLDYGHKNEVDIPDQKRVLEAQARLAREIGKPIVIHCNNGTRRRKQGIPEDANANDDCLEILRRVSLGLVGRRLNQAEVLDKEAKIHRHCFMETKEIAQQWIDAFPNVRFGLTPIVFYAPLGCMAEFLRWIEPRRILLETDGPFFPPKALAAAAGVRGVVRGHPGQAYLAAIKLAQMQQPKTTPDEMLKICRQNTRDFYGV